MVYDTNQSHNRFDIHQVAMQPAEPQQRVIEPPTKKEPSTAHPQRGRSQRPPRARAPPTNTLPASPVEPTESPAPAPTPEDAPGSQEVMFARPLVKAAALAKQLSAASVPTFIFFFYIMNWSRYQISFLTQIFKSVSNSKPK
jgi:hypothetical protein